MATKTVCDVCGGEVQDGIKEPFDFRTVRMVLDARIFLKGNWQDMDICQSCRTGAAQKADTSPQPARDPYGNDKLRFQVTMTGVRTPGPHAAFLFEDGAQKFLALHSMGGEIKDIQTGKITKAPGTS